MAYTFANGSGTAADPYLVATAADLNGVRDYLSAHFRQTADIDLSGYGNWVPIGTYVSGQQAEFRGTYDGAGHTVDKLTIDRTGENYIGLFGFTNGATIKNLEVINASVSGTNNYVGGLVGYTYSSTITNCYSTGNVSGSNFVGGLVGYTYSSSTITNCYSTGSVSGTNNHVGGLVGVNASSAVASSYYDSQTSGCSDTGKGNPKTTAEMKQQATFVDWDFDKYWSITDSYPFLTPAHYAKGTGAVAYAGTAVQSSVFVPVLSAAIEYTATGAGDSGVSAKGAGAVVYLGTARASKRLEISGLADTNVKFFSFLDVLYFYNGTNYYYYNDLDGGPVTDIAYVPTITLGRAPTGGGTANEDLNYLSNSWKDSFSGTADAEEYHLSFAGLSDTPVKAWVNGELKEETTDFTVDRATGIVAFNTLPGEGTDNVVIQAEKANLMNPNYILQATQFIIYGGKNDNRVFACRGNTRYHSGLNNPTYWPESNYAAITSDAENLVGFGKMYDYLINLKENSLTFTTIDSDPGGDIIFPVYPLNDEYGCLAPDSIQPVANGLIFLAQTATGAPAGVVYLSPTTVRNQLNARVISEDINTSVHAGITGLTEYSRAEQAAAKSYIHDKKYWLRVGDRVWILDLRESDFSMGKYCWYPYDGPAAKANCFMEHEGNFYVGGDTGGIIYRENDELNDIQDAINARWTSPIVFCGSRSWTKDFEELHIVFGPQVRANHTLSFITDDGQEDVPLEIESARIFSYADISYGEFTYGSNPYPSKQTELVGYSAEYLQWIIANNELNQGLTILSQELDYLWGERS